MAVIDMARSLLLYVWVFLKSYILLVQLSDVVLHLTVEFLELAVFTG
jgi:hypothetical protein